MLADDERYTAVIDCEHLGAGDTFAKLFCVCVSVILGGAEYGHTA